jgi:hypothetical protein
VGLCHGISGSAYALLAALSDSPWAMAHQDGDSARVASSDGVTPEAEDWTQVGSLLSGAAGSAPRSSCPGWTGVGFLPHLVSCSSSDGLDWGLAVGVADRVQLL